MRIDNGQRSRLIIEGVFEGMAGVVGNMLSFAPNRTTRDPAMARGALLNGVPIMLKPIKDAEGPFWTSRYEVMS